jgi:predicted nucleic acid-binding protein
MTTFADTNALVAFMLNGREVQRASVVEHAEHNGPLVVSESILAETYWVLMRTYAQDPVEVAQALRHLLLSSTFRAWDVDVAHTALALLVRYAHLGLPDCLLAARAALGDAVYTFDRRLAATIERM